MKKRKIIEYETCPRCKSKGIILSENFGGLPEECGMCKGKGRVVKKEETIIE